MYQQEKSGGGIPAKYIQTIDEYHKKMLMHKEFFKIDFEKYNISKKNELINVYEK